MEEIPELLPKKRKEKEKIRKNLKDMLWQDDIAAMEKLIRMNLTGKRREKALNKWNNYFHANSKRMQYALFESEGLPRGSGSVESAIRRVINLRLKSCGLFWKKENAEIYLFLRSQLITGRWKTFFENLTNRGELFDNQKGIKSNNYLRWAA